MILDTGKNGFAKYFVFAEIIAKNICPRIAVDYTDTRQFILLLRKD